MAEIERISKADNTFQHLEVIKRNRAKRTHFGEVFIEGVRPINLARDNGWTFKQVVFQSDKQLSHWAAEYINSSASERVIALTPELMDLLSDREEPSELIAVVERKNYQLASLADAADPLFVIVDRPSNPGNLGSIIRSCDAFGATSLLISGHGADPYDPKAIRSSLGTAFCLPMYEIESNDELEVWIDTQRIAYPNLSVIGTSAKATTAISTCVLSGPTILILGNETHGISKRLCDLVDEMVTIPIRGHASSLNVAAAATVALYERSRQLLEKLGDT